MATGLFPFLAMFIVQAGYAGMNITSKLAIESGMNPLVLVAYRQLFATASMAPFAYFLERKTAPRLTRTIMFQIFLSSLTGVTGNQVFYFVGLKYTTATIACALTNLLPAFTFVLTVLFRQEKLRIKTMASHAKVLGTILGVGGALLLSLYHGENIGLGESKIHWKYGEKMQGTDSSGAKTNLLLGPFMVFLSALSWSIWFIIQAKTSSLYPAPYTSSTYMCLLASIECAVIALCFQHNTSAWSLTSTIRLTSSLYAGIICTGLAYCLMSWSIQRKGPLYVVVFTPLQLVLTAILSWALLRDKLYVGTAVGSVIIVVGLYSVLWGKNKEANVEEAAKMTQADPMNDNDKEVKNDVELQDHMP
ncbi:hypothetical protein L6164_010423 [Bauhinia variegata]|uniref:Uncharacterized protein n=1 Tax=Bauhinia variegata TaxID=167791 RepID=A0ACB9PN69_BAUVA|nr:hypothetical protein L6164_010423 [Bauhinia variegata]